MALLIVPVAPEETDLLTLTEWRSLVARARVFFERADHPLIAELAAQGVEAGAFDDEPEPWWNDDALVADPASPRVVDLARRGAEVAAGASSPPDALSAAHAAPVLRRSGAAFTDLVAIMARLRSDDGCPWDREQDHRSLAVHFVEEVYEVLDAIERGEVGGELEEELGDVLLQVAFHARMAEQAGRFDVAGAARSIAAKLIRRHPHVFGDVEVAGSSEVVSNWEALKAKEKRRGDPFDGIPAALPALLAAYKTQKRAAALGFSVDADEARARVEAALDAGRDGLGDALFWAVALARARGVDPEEAVRAATRRFRASF